MNEKNNGRLFRYDRLYAVECVLSRCRAAFRVYQSRKPVDFGLPSRRWFRLPGIPGVMSSRTEPYIHLTVRVNLKVCQAQKAGLIACGSRNPLDERLELNGHEIQPDSDFHQVLLQNRPRLSAGLRSRVCYEREFHRIPAAVTQGPAVESKTILLQELQRELRVVGRRTQFGIEPELVGR